VKTIMKALVAPHEPSNEGWFRPLTVTAPDGTIFTAQKPSPTGWYYEGVAQASDLVWKALAPLVPERFSAGSYLSLCATYFSGAAADGLFVHIEPQNGGWGATEGRDGASGMIAVTDGDTYNYSIELLEAKFPLLIRRHSARERRPHRNAAMADWRRFAGQPQRHRSGTGDDAPALHAPFRFPPRPRRPRAHLHRRRRRMGRAADPRSRGRRARCARWVGDRRRRGCDLWGRDRQGCAEGRSRGHG
jgi:hypothetical protein